MTKKLLLTTLLGTLFTLACCVQAQDNPVIPVSAPAPHPTFTPSSPNINASGYVLMDVKSGKILAESNADTRMPPASLTKLMSAYIISNAIKNGSIHWEDKVRISTKAWKTEGSRMFVKVDDEVPVKDLMHGIIVASGNDATVALAEHIAGTEEAFASLMNEQAAQLGMKNSHFVDSTGLPNREHYTTPRDLARLTQAYIKNFPADYHYYSEKWFTYNGIRQPNRNRLLWRLPHADGLKTGHTNEAGYCLVGSAEKDGMRLISVVMGAPSDQSRTEDSIRLLTYGFRFYESHQLYKANAPLVQAKVWEGKKSKTTFGLAHNLHITVPNGQFKRLETATELNSPLKAPLIKGKAYGTLNVLLNKQVIFSAPLVALDNNPQGGLFERASDKVKYKFSLLFSKSEEKVNTG